MISLAHELFMSEHYPVTLKEKAMKRMLWVHNDIHKWMFYYSWNRITLHPFHVAITRLQSYCNLVLFYAPSLHFKGVTVTLLF